PPLHSSPARARGVGIRAHAWVHVPGGVRRSRAPAAVRDPSADRSTRGHAAPLGAWCTRLAELESELACQIAVGVEGDLGLEQEDGIARGVASQAGFELKFALVDAGGVGVMLDCGVRYDWWTGARLVSSRNAKERAQPLRRLVVVTRVHSGGEHSLRTLDTVS